VTAKKAAPRRPRIPPIIAAVVQPVARRLARIEDLLVEMRFEQDVQLKRVAALHAQIDTLTEQVSANRMAISRLARNRRK
jgi:Mg2+ and Co2+ transporter CorA